MNQNVTSVVSDVATVAPARGSPGQVRGSPLTRRVISGGILAAAVLVAMHLAVTEFHHAYFGRLNLPDLGPFTRFEFPTIGHVYDAQGEPLIELAREYREIVRYEDIPPIVRNAILAAEDGPCGGARTEASPVQYRTAVALATTLG